MNYIRDFIEFTWFSNFCLASWWGESMKVLSTNLNHIVGFSVVILKAISSVYFILSLVWEHWAYIQAFFLRMYVRTQLELCCLCSECYLHKVIYQNNGIFPRMFIVNHRESLISGEQVHTIQWEWMSAFLSYRMETYLLEDWQNLQVICSIGGMSIPYNWW